MTHLKRPEVSKERRESAGLTKPVLYELTSLSNTGHMRVRLLRATLQEAHMHLCFSEK